MDIVLKCCIYYVLYIWNFVTEYCLSNAAGQEAVAAKIGYQQLS